MPLATISNFVDGVLKSQLLDSEQQNELQRLQSSVRDTRGLAQELLRREWLTAYQVNQILHGKGGGLILGPFILLERIGEGGMGQVFKARQKLLNRIVALKVIRKQFLDNPKVIQRFLREIRAAGQLSHPHIVRAYDADQVNGTYYIAMEFISGHDLAKLVKDNGPLRVDQACEYVRQAALGLQHAFERGMVHRDIKPANLLVTPAVASDRRRSSGLIQRSPNLPPAWVGQAFQPDGQAGKPDLPGEGSTLSGKRSSSMLPRSETAQHYPWGIVKILDMGLARCNDPFTGHAATHLTQVGSVMGTPEFIAPEQARDSHTSDIRADLYSLGCTFYFLLTGQPPFPTGSLTEKLLQHQLDEAAPVGPTRRAKLLAWNGPDGPGRVMEEMLPVPAPVDVVIRRLLSKRPEERYQTPVELASELQAILKQMAAGTLSKEEPAEQNLTVSYESVGAVPVVPAAESTLFMPPIVQLAHKPAPANRVAAKIALGLASLGGLAFVTLLTVVALVISRGGRTQAGTPDPEPSAQTKNSDEPTWKRTLRKAVQKGAAWEEARQEMLRHRWSFASAAQARQIDDLLMKMPTPLDALDRAQFDAPLPPGMPTEVIGMYGFADANINKPVTSVAVSPNGRWLISNEDNGVRLFDLQGSGIPYKILAHNSRVNHVVVSPDGRLLASASEDGTVRVWDVALRNRQLSFDKHKKPVTKIAFNHDGTLLASAGKDGVIRLWNPRTGGELRSFDSQAADVSVLAFSHESREIFWGGNGKELRWTSVKNGAGAVSGKFDTKFPVQRVLAFQPHGNLLIFGGSQGLLHVCVWNGKTLVEKTSLKEHQQVNQIAFAPDGKTFVAVGNDPSVTFWDAQSLKLQKTWNTLRTPGHSAAFSPDGRHFVIGAAHNQVLVVRLANHDMEALKAALE